MPQSLRAGRIGNPEVGFSALWFSFASSLSFFQLLVSKKLISFG
jgi:hypothetical protein